MVEKRLLAVFIMTRSSCCVEALPIARA